MSMIRISASRAALYPTIRQYAAHMLGEVAYQRRQDLGLSVAEAAELSGLALSQWMALEEGPGYRSRTVPSCCRSPRPLKSTRFASTSG